MKLSGMEYFFTQKLNWNNINKFPHSTFLWKGLDGSQVLAHMAPGDTYAAHGKIEDVLYTESNNKDKCFINHEHSVHLIVSQT